MSPSPGGQQDRTIPDWMDPGNHYERVSYLYLQAKQGFDLPNNPFVIGRSIEQHVGQIEGGYFERNKKRYVLRIRNKEQARKLLDLEVLMDGTPIAIGYHPELNFRKFVVVCSEVEGMTDDELLKELLPQKITAVRRITKKTTTGIIGTSTLILTINSTVVPEFITFGFIRLRTRIYYPQPLICRHCLQYGHPKNKCLNEKACIVCSGNHSSDLCTAQAAARKIAETPCTISYAAVVKNQHEVYNQEKRKQHPKKQTLNDLTEQQAIQKRAHHPTEETTPAKNLTASPPSKKLTPQPSTQATEDGIEDTPQKESGKMTIDALEQSPKTSVGAMQQLSVNVNIIS
ncbi:uncharacterized protein LOC129753675 [Uranotaenia lowii]|uniref:uncharacterized protein LOC129753675 n=1 Tax=Uranotaenia lowii TaxID=190385 RepID=UPI00247ABF11|nr:uncharacterized protein LOC129753675 [Uranotaenia lowii]